MIINAADKAADYLARVQNCAFWGGRLSETYTCYSAYANIAEFFLVGESAALQLLGGAAAVCGSVEDKTELCGILNMYNIKQVFCGDDNADLPGFEKEPIYIMASQGAAVKAKGYNLKPIEPRALLSFWHDMPKAQAESTFADLCLRRNYGMAQCWGIYKNGNLLGACAVTGQTKNEAYISFVAVDEASRGKGVGSCMLALLEEKYPEVCLYLECVPELCGFYLKNGFIAVEQRYRLCRK